MSALTYVYCLVLSARRPSVRGLESVGLPGGHDARALDAGGGLWLIAVSVPAEAYNSAALARGLQDLEWVGRLAMAHEAAVEQFLSARALLPMQLFTLFTSDERALQHVARQRREIRRVVARLERKVEWGLRLTFDGKAARAGVAAAPSAGATGIAYLARKREVRDSQHGRLRAAKIEADRLFELLTREAAEARRRTATEQAAPGARLLLDAAFLVPSTRTRTFRATVGRLAREIGTAGVVVALTGPWPPYNFVSAGEAASRRPTRSRDKAAH